MRWLSLIWIGWLTGCLVPPTSGDRRLRASQETQGEIRRVRALIEVATAVARIDLEDTAAVQGFRDESRLTAADPLVAVARQVWTTARANEPGQLGLVVAVLHPSDSNGRGSWGEFNGVVLPERIDGRHCFVLLHSDLPWINNTGRSLEGAFARAAAPCLYWARYGQPGNAVAGWLTRTGHDALAIGSGLALLAPGGDGSYNPLTELRLRSGLATRLMAPWLLRIAILPPYLDGTAFVGCLAGREVGCAAGIDPPGDPRVRALAPGVVRTRRDWSAWQSSWIGVGPIDRSVWLSKLIRDRGEEKFRQLWQADGDLATAFERIYGEPLGRSVHAALVRERQSTGGQDQVLLGPTVGGVEFGATVGWALVVLVVPLLAARRRVIGR